jgi:UDP-N-acetylmuramoylalanine--D-glutamate ligase
MAEICKNAGMLTWLAGNIGYPLTALAGKTRPEDVVVAEVSSFQCESFDTFRPEVAAVLNITEDHMDRHGSMEEYAAMKRRVFERQSEEQTAVLNWDDPRCRAMAEGLRARVAWFSRREPVAYGAYLSGQGEIAVNMNGSSRAICPAAEVQLPGLHNLENALAAAAMSAALGVPLPVIRHTLRSFAGVEHRLETVRGFEGVRYINDSKGTNVDATLRAIESMDAPTVLILGGSDKQVDFAPLARSVADHPMIERVVLIGETAPQITAALDAVEYKGYVHEGNDMEAALRRCRELAGPGWNVLLSPACASFDMFEDFEHRGRVFKQSVNDLR